MSMEEEYLLGLLLEIVKRSGVFLLEERGQVAPYGISIVNEQGEPASYFPADHAAEASASELLELVVIELRARAREQAPLGVAVVTDLTNDGERAFVAQIETPRSSLRAVFQYRRMLDTWMIDEPRFDRNLLVPAGVCWSFGLPV
jgi:hypothetical protein